MPYSSDKSTAVQNKCSGQDFGFTDGQAARPARASASILGICDFDFRRWGRYSRPMGAWSLSVYHQQRLLLARLGSDARRDGQTLVAQKRTLATRDQRR